MLSISEIQRKSEQKVINFLNKPNAERRTVVLGICIVLLSFFNNLSPLAKFEGFYTEVFVNKSENYLYKITKDRASNFKKDWVYDEGASNNRTFRWFQPTLVKVLRIQHVSLFLYGLQLILGVVFLWLLNRFLNRILDDKIAAFFGFLAFCGIYVGSAFFIENAGYGDFYSYFFLFLAIYFRQWYLIFGFISLALWNDERSNVACGMVFLFWFLNEQKGEKLRIRVNIQMVAVLVAMALYWAIREFFLIRELGLQNHYVEGEFKHILLQSWQAYGFKFLWAYEGLWVPILFALFLLIYTKDYFRFALILFAILVIQTLSLTTFDSTRSGCFGFIVIFISIFILKDKLDIKDIRSILFWSAVLSFLHPLATKTHATGFFLM